MTNCLASLLLLASWSGDVRVDGALRAIFHDGQTGAVVALDELLPAPHLYGLGALADLAGEVTIVDGTAYVSYPNGETTTEPTASATLLVTTKVESWRDLTTDAAIAFDEIDDAIARLAESAGADVSKRVPFLVEGTVEDLEWHVIDGGKLTEGGNSHEDHLAAGTKGRSDRATVTLVGFYSSGDMGVFTHMGSRTHLHSVTTDPPATGHVDHVTLPKGITIRFPE